MPGSAAADFSFLSLFLQAHIVVKLVMIGLVIASVWGWGIIIEKSFLFARARREAEQFERLFWSAIARRSLRNVAPQRAGAWSHCSSLRCRMARSSRALRIRLRACSTASSGDDVTHLTGNGRGWSGACCSWNVGSTGRPSMLFGTVGASCQLQSSAVSNTPACRFVGRPCEARSEALACSRHSGGDFYKIFQPKPDGLSAPRMVLGDIRGDRLPPTLEDLMHGAAVRETVQRNAAADAAAARRWRDQRHPVRRCDVVRSSVSWDGAELPPPRARSICQRRSRTRQRSRQRNRSL